MSAPQSEPDHLATLTWDEKHTILKGWFHNELLEAADNPKLRQREWWVQQSHARCGGCGANKYRVEIGGHWRSPFYTCLCCGTVESLFDLTSRPRETESETA